MKSNRITVLLLTIIVSSFYGQHFERVSAKVNNLKEEIETTFQNKKSEENFWIGYSIDSNTRYNIAVGSIFIKGNQQNNLKSLLTGVIDYKSYQNENNKRSEIRISGRSINFTKVIEDADGKISSEPTAILIRYDRNSTDINDFAEIVISNLSYQIDLFNYSLYWIGHCPTSLSAKYLLEQYDKMGNQYLKEELLPAIALHFNHEEITSFLIREFNNRNNEDLREEIIFWLGLQNNPEAFEVLTKVIDEEETELAENAVMALGFIDSEEALNFLIKIAKHNSEEELREQAIYAIGRKAVARAELALKNFVENDPNIEVKKAAVYALANKDEKNLDYLINIAKEHTSLELRKAAIYSISNIGNKKVVKTLVELVKGNF